MNPKVSVVMPAYNMEKYIAQSIESVIVQSYRDWELLIVDDGSTDNTFEACRPYIKSDSRIKYFYKENGGLPSARNYAIERANGKLLALLDSDDLWLPDKLSVSVYEFERGNQDLLFTNGYHFKDGSDLTRLDTLKPFFHRGNVFYGDQGLKEFIKSNRVHVPTVLVKKDVINKLGGFPPFDFAEDYCMWLLMLLNDYRLRVIEDMLSLYRERPNSMLHSAQRKFVKIFKLFEFLNANYPGFTKHSGELKGFLRLYITFDYDRRDVNELRHMMQVLKIENRLVNYIVYINRLLPRRVESKLLRMVLY